MRGTKTIHNISDQVFGKLPPRKISPRSGSVFGLGLVLELGLGAIFLGDNFPRTIRSKALNISRLYPNIKSSHRTCSIKKVILNNSSKPRGKYLCQSLLLYKAAGVRPQAYNFIKKDTLAQVFSCAIYKMFKKTIFTEHI